MKRSIFCVLLGVLLCLCPGAYAAQARYGVVITPSGGGAVNLRIRAGAGQAVVGWAANGDEVEILHEGNTWHRVRLLKNGRVGWMYGRYLRFTDFDRASSSSGAYLCGTVGEVTTRYRASRVNLREGPGVSYAVNGKYGRGTRLEILEEAGAWLRVRVAGTQAEGWMSSAYVSRGLAARTTGRVNLRRGAGRGFAVIRTLDNRLDITVTWVGEEWSLVEAGGDTGYISNSYYAFR